MIVNLCLTRKINKYNIIILIILKITPAGLPTEAALRVLVEKIG
jgi:hypothetical protein